MHKDAKTMYLPKTNLEKNLEPTWKFSRNIIIIKVCRDPIIVNCFGSIHKGQNNK